MIALSQRAMESLLGFGIASMAVGLLVYVMGRAAQKRGLTGKN